MMGLKRYIRHGLAVSVIGHLAALIVGLFFVGANAFHAPPPEAVVVEVVTPDEMPRFEGTPSNLHSSGSETPSPANGKGPVTQAPPPQPRPQQQQQSRERPTPQREAKEAPANELGLRRFRRRRARRISRRIVSERLEPDPPLALSKPNGFHRVMSNGGRLVREYDRGTLFPGIIACTLQPHRHWRSGSSPDLEA
jgi:hypothetical protein